MKSLQDVNLSFTAITSVGLEHVLRLPVLRSLRIIGCNSISDSDLIELMLSVSDVDKEAAADALLSSYPTTKQVSMLVSRGVLPVVVALLARGSAA